MIGYVKIDVGVRSFWLRQEGTGCNPRTVLAAVMTEYGSCAYKKAGHWRFYTAGKAECVRLMSESEYLPVSTPSQPVRLDGNAVALQWIGRIACAGLFRACLMSGSFSSYRAPTVRSGHFLWAETCGYPSSAHMLHGKQYFTLRRVCHPPARQKRGTYETLYYQTHNIPAARIARACCGGRFLPARTRGGRD